MIDSLNSSISMMSMSGMSSVSGNRPPPPPPPAEAVEESVSLLQDSIESGEIDTEELSAQLTSQFGTEADGIVSEDGDVDFDALTDLLTKSAAEDMQTKLTERFGEDAASIVNDSGEVDHEALSALMEANGNQGPPPPKGDGNGNETMDFLKSMLGESGIASGYGSRGQAQNTSNTTSFINLVA
ncbi:hypothetical protein [Hirschia baltica]|uniref:Uncharacterized protein n=1 Tax=Hirschia baltica (strain ATCC 49814 / DSM 5838 / IFAM 1418) TaxID=582402 RepID=C6XN71_HIRBI|nr:hypothetical protein [Hirschia baltica]ACT58241.1 hypothetical protein Hbal_0539 [Hirschia baltica ATCC 49814]